MTKKFWFGMLVIGIPLLLLAQSIRWYNDAAIPQKTVLDGSEIISIQQTGPNAFRWALLEDIRDVTSGSPTNPVQVFYVSNLFATNIYASNMYVTNITVLANFDARGKVTINYLNPATNYYFFTTNLYAGNTYVSNYFATNVFNDTYVSNYLQSSYYITNQYVTNLYSTNIVNNNSYVSNFWQTNILFNDTFVSNYFTTNLFSTTVTNIYNTLNTTIITNLYSTNITVNNEYVNNEYVTNLYATYVNPVTNFYFYSTNLFVNNSYVSNYFTTNVFNDTYVSNYLYTNVFVTNQYVTNLYSTNIVNNNSYVSNFWQTNIFFVDNSVSNYFTTNIFNTFQTNIYNTFNNLNVTNATLYGTTTFSPISGIPEGGVAEILDTNGVVTIKMHGNGGVEYLTQIKVKEWAWVGPTNKIDFSLSCLQTYLTYTPVAVTNVSGTTNGWGNSCLLEITNASSSNITFFVTASGWKIGRGDTTTCTNGGVFKAWFYYDSNGKTIATKEFP